MSRFLITTYHGSGSPQIPGTDGNTYKDDDDDTIYYYDDGWVSTVLTAPDAPVLTMSNPLTSDSNATWDAGARAASYTLEFSEYVYDIDLEEYSYVVRETITGITDLTYALHNFFRDWTILGNGYSGNANSRIRNSWILYFDPPVTGSSTFTIGTNTTITLGQFGNTGTWNAAVTVNLTSSQFRIRVKSVNGAGESAWASDQFDPQFAEGQFSLLGITNVDANFVNFNTDYGDDMKLSYAVSGSFGSWNLRSVTGDPAHVEAAFKTLPIIIEQIV